MAISPLPTMESLGRVTSLVLKHNRLSKLCFWPSLSLKYVLFFICLAFRSLICYYVIQQLVIWREKSFLKHIQHSHLSHGQIMNGRTSMGDGNSAKILQPTPPASRTRQLIHLIGILPLQSQNRIILRPILRELLGCNSAR